MEERVVDIQLLKVRNLVSSIYDIQKVRIAVGNRLVTSFNIQLGQAPSQKKEEQDKEAQKLIAVLHKEYMRITDLYAGNSSSLKKIIVKEGENLNLQYIRNELDYKLIMHYDELLQSEQGMVKVLEKELQAVPIYTQFLKTVKGCGPLMSGVVIAYLDPYKARHVSSFWKYAGLDVVTVPQEDGSYKNEGRSKQHCEDREYVAKDGTVKTKKSITFNPFLKTKLIGVLGTSFLRVKSPYADAYYNYRNRLDNSNVHKDKSDIVKYRMAIRYMVKQFLRDLWVAWRKLEGLPVSLPYEVEKLGNKPHEWNYSQCQQADRDSYSVEG